MKRILVTGAAGFIGSHVARALGIAGHQVVGVDNFSPYYDPALKRRRVKQLAPHLPLVEADITDESAMARLFREGHFDQVCHMAAQAGVRYSLEKPLIYEQTNGLGTLALLEQCRRHNVPSFVYASSSSVYGSNTERPSVETQRVDQPLSLYAATKRSNELMAHVYHQLYGLKVTGLRLFTVYGPWGRPDMALFKFARAILGGECIDLYNAGRMRRDFTFIDDIATGILAALERDFPEEIFNLGRGEPVELLEFVRVLEQALGQKALTRSLPMQPGDVSDTFADISRARDLLGYQPQVSVPEGVERFVTWYREYFKI